MKQLLLINDVCCKGKVALTLSLPIARIMQIETDVIPTVILSTHTGYRDFYKLDTTQVLLHALNQFQNLHSNYHTILTGYFHDASQIETFLHHLPPCQNLIVDPIMGDNGKTYSTITLSYIENMRTLCEKATFILPNWTEACLLANVSYIENPSLQQIETVINYLSNNKNHVIITGITYENNILVAYKHTQFTYFIKPKQSGHYFGTGDLFAILFTTQLIHKYEVKIAIENTMEFIINCIKDTQKFNYQIQNELFYENQLPTLFYWIKEIHNEK